VVSGVLVITGNRAEKKLAPTGTRNHFFGPGKEAGGTVTSCRRANSTPTLTYSTLPTYSTLRAYSTLLSALPYRTAPHRTAPHLPVCLIPRRFSRLPFPSHLTRACRPPTSRACHFASASCLSTLPEHSVSLTSPLPPEPWPSRERTSNSNIEAATENHVGSR
jgi:hypothetical protein